MGTRRKAVKFIVSLLTIISMIISNIPISVCAQEKGKTAAVRWLEAVASESGEWEDNGLLNLTCDALAVLRNEGIDTESAYLTQWEEKHQERNVDEQAHLAWAQGDESCLKELWKYQNEDGGFGLTKKFASDVYDTMLVLLAETAQNGTNSQEEEGEKTKTANEEAVQNALDYLAGQQHLDGGFGYTGISGSNPGLSAEIGLVFSSMDIENDTVYKNLDNYCQNAFTLDFSEESFYEQAELARYLYRRNVVEDTEKIEQLLQDVQKEDGSIYEDGEDTIQYILLVNEIEKYHTLKFMVNGLVTEADAYVLEADCEQEVGLQTVIQYTTNQEISGVIRYTLLEDGVEKQTEEVECVFSPSMTEQTGSTSMKIQAVEEKEYALRTEILSRDDVGEETVWESGEFSFSVHKTEKQELVLQAETCQKENYGVNLLWNDISDEDNRYGYRVFRKAGDGEWETRSTWDGEEKVKVLNIYPCVAARDYLVEWMEETLSDSEEPAGKGLFDIDTVYIDDYNRTPETYLKDEEGIYKYDVLVFGTYDANNGKDLSQCSYQATLDYMDTGRGVLFGHDTVAEYSGNTRMQFRKFGERMGVKMINDNYLVQSNKVKVVNEGFLTSYPWKLTGTLSIPTAHPAGLYVGGTTSSTMWLEFQGKYLTDSDTGSKNSAYLFSKDALAMIQTGHSNGQATDDERKVIANTLFYLKQLTNKTSASDKSFYDEAAPEIVDVSEVTDERQTTIQAKDVGTLYQYYVEAVNAGNREEEGVQSNIAEAEALSGIRGFIVGTGGDENHLEGLLVYDDEGNLVSDVLTAEEGSLTYTIEGMEPGESGYLHIYAVDYAGNVSAEMVKNITVPEKKLEVSEQAYFHSPYALFASDEDVSLNCGGAEIQGDIYGNSGFQFQGTTLSVEGKASTAGTISLAGGWMELTEQEEGVDTVVLPDYMGIILQDIEAEYDPVEEMNVYDSTEITNPILCNSTTGTWCSRLKMGASLVSGKSVNLNADTISCGTDTPVVLCSRKGDVNIQATKLNGKGLIYAPEGTVIINVSELNYEGTIIAKKIKIQAGYVSLNR